MQRPFQLVLATLLVAMGISPVHGAEKVSLKNLLPQMTDLSLLCEYPDPSYVTKQFSSYDRASQTPGNEDWFANGDRGFMLYDGVLEQETPYFKTGPQQGRAPDGRFPAGTRIGIAPTHKRVGGYVWAYATAADGSAVGNNTPQGYIPASAIRMDPQGHVLAEMEGPGCVVNIWSANPEKAGNVRIYLDGSEKPVIEAPLQTLLDGKWTTEVGGKSITPFPDPIACERSRGFNLYFPIAYARHCKITVDHPDIYYHVDYRIYPAGTEVETFSLEGFNQWSEQLAGDLKTLPLKTPNSIVHGYTLDQDLQHGRSLQLHIDGSKAIERLVAEIDNASDSGQLEAWRGLLLKVTFDGALQAQICCPLGDFFGSSPGFNPYISGPFQVRKLGTTAETRSSWHMPFEKSAHLEIRNMGEKNVKLTFDVLAVPRPWTDRSMHFHAKWRTETLKTRPFRDWTYCDLTGKGVFVGDMLSVTNPVQQWWGEGDEKIYVDGESFPSWFGTGSEDYYAYAWSDTKTFEHPYHNQTRCDGPGNRGRTSVNRFHILDAIPFTRSFRFDMEVWHWAPNIDVNYAATSYWYARPGATDDFQEPRVLAIAPLPAAPPPFHIAGAIEGEKLAIANKSGDFDVGPQEMTSFADAKWSGDSQLWVRPAKAGEWVDLKLPVPAEGRYHVIVHLTKARDYGIVQFRLHGKWLGKPIDCFRADAVSSTGAIDLGTIDLKRGTAPLRVEVVGTNPKSDGLRYMWGLDCVVLKPADHHHRRADQTR